MAVRWLSRSDLEADEGQLDRNVYDEKVAKIARDAWPRDHVGELPVVLDISGVIDTDLTEFAMRLKSFGASIGTVTSYAIEADVFSRYLRERSIRFEEITDSDLYGYRTCRLFGDLQVRITRRSWTKIAVVIRQLCDFRGVIIPSMEWSKFRYGGKDDEQVRMISLERYINLRQTLGLSRSPLRNAAFAELLVTTGLRCGEASALLKCEIPSVDRFQESTSARVWVSELTTKNRKGRFYNYTKRVATDFVQIYIDEERSNHVKKALCERFPFEVYGGGDLLSHEEYLFFRVSDKGYLNILTNNGEFRCDLDRVAQKYGAP
ncbi:MAG TPA: hypothetical protein VGN82_07955 [Bosea sp. (in: a-proteobacteria)]|jgi:site-specific recombinase XerD|uniref:hypothetical protein n=1 Tax=Bosea sp. (in: a-proteobacteria) TaxID=1871050 RepID=UPI002E11E3EC|nr:hypothetical protein [Bosea sp. (in: a-proteobacteria)]